MGIKSKMIFGHVMHKRLLPKVNYFRYRIYYLMFPISAVKKLSVAVNRFGLLSFYTKDHGDRQGGDLEKWARGILADFNLTPHTDGELVLITLPRVFGYVFNPVSFWLCYDKHHILRAVLCEVNNTFGQTHTYLCANPDGAEILPNDTFEGKKVFYVSPFLPRKGGYVFRFNITNDTCGIWINYINAEGNKQLITSLTGTLAPMTFWAVQKAFWGYPLLTFKAVFCIHWQALKLFAKGITYTPRPPQKPDKISGTNTVKNRADLDT